jgi:hypothetical protein
MPEYSRAACNAHKAGEKMAERYALDEVHSHRPRGIFAQTPCPRRIGVQVRLLNLLRHDPMVTPFALALARAVTPQPHIPHNDRDQHPQGEREREDRAAREGCEDRDR